MMTNSDVFAAIAAHAFALVQNGASSLVVGRSLVLAGARALVARDHEPEAIDYIERAISDLTRVLAEAKAGQTRPN